MSHRIIIVDDKEQDRYMLQVMLTSAGYKVETAPDGAKALAIAKQNPPSLIISDVLMPVMDGFTLCREWHKDPVLSSIPFVFYTATYTDPRDEDFALNLGADRFIVKPISPSAFLDIIKDLLTKYSELKERKRVPSTENLKDEGVFFKKYSEVLIRKLEDKLELFRIVFTTDPSPMFILSEKFKITELNISAEKLIGLKAEQALDKDLIENFIPKNFQSDFKDKMEKVLAGESLISLEVPILKADGITERIVVWNAQRIIRPSGIVEGIFLSGNDITEKKIAEKHRIEIENQLRQAQKMEAIGLLAASVAHDFNNFLTAIIASAEIISSSVKGNPELEFNIEQILNTSKKATELVKHLLAFSRKQPIEPRVININLLLKEMEPMLRKLIHHNIKLTTIFEPQLWEVKADPFQIEQVIMNMIVNAKDAMPEGGNITIETSNVSLDESFTKHNIEMKVGDYVLITISDTGCGMDEKTISRIFEPFFTTKEEGKGTGLGLSTAYGIIKQHGGSITCTSEVGKGTKFKIYLPRHLK